MLSVNNGSCGRFARDNPDVFHLTKLLQSRRRHFTTVLTGWVTLTTYELIPIEFIFNFNQHADSSLTSVGLTSDETAPHQRTRYISRVHCILNVKSADRLCQAASACSLLCQSLCSMRCDTEPCVCHNTAVSPSHLYLTEADGPFRTRAEKKTREMS